MIEHTQMENTCERFCNQLKAKQRELRTWELVPKNCTWSKKRNTIVETNMIEFVHVRMSD